MYKKSDFRRLQILGSGKKNTKIYKAVHLNTGKIYALKEIEAKNLEKLNQYKQQAVQLIKVQNHPNVVKSYGYYFSQTKYKTFKLGIITEFMDEKTNLQYIYRKRKKSNLYWSEKQLVIMYCSLISTCSYLQNRGICHRDIKPANIFLNNSNEMKLIDFGQSKDYFYDPSDQSRQTFTMATIRGTPQYLSPILWKAHVIDGSSRFAEHNIYKSDVFSAGLVLIQLALMNQVTGFNSKTFQINGEKLIKENLKILEKMYSINFSQLFGLLLRFNQSDRPSFSEIQALFYDKQINFKQKNKLINQYIKLYNKDFSNISKIIQNKQTNTLKSTNPLAIQEQQYKKNNSNNNNENNSHFQQQQQQMMQTRPPLKSNYYKDSTLMLHQSCYWFEFGGTSTGRFSINRQKWKIDTCQDGKKFPLHFTVVFIPTLNSYFLLGGLRTDNFRIFQNGKKLLLNKNQIPTFRNFFSTVYYSQRIFIFGGYDDQNHIQLKTCQCYDIINNKWINIQDLKICRSQTSSCRINDNQILICGGYNKQKGTLNCIEKYFINKNKFQLLTLKLPIPLRRFMIVRVAKNKALILGGLTTLSKQSQRVFKLDYQNMIFNELENLEKGGVIENQILVDKDGSLHIFLQHSNGTSPHSHIKYPYDPSNEQSYTTKQI